MSIPHDELRVLVVDDHALYRRGLVMELDDADDLEVIAEAGDGDQAIELATTLAPDVILMDVRMPGTGGIEACRRIVEQTPSARILMLTVSDDSDDLLEAVKAGAAGYLLKESSIFDIGTSVRMVAQGCSFVSPTLAGRLLEEFTALAERAASADGDRPSDLLTEREVAVLEAMAAGRQDAAIGEETGLSEHAVRNHVRNILEKLQLATRTEAVMFAMRGRIIER